MGKISVPVTTFLVSKKRHVRDWLSIMQPPYPLAENVLPRDPKITSRAASGTYIRSFQTPDDLNCSIFTAILSALLPICPDTNQTTSNIVRHSPPGTEKPATQPRQFDRPASLLSRPERFH